MPKRMKTPAAPAITSLEELVARVGRFATLSAEIERLAAEADEAIAAIKSELAQKQQPLAVEMKAILAAAKPWWAANSEQLTDGKRKSVELAGCLIGERLSKPSLAFPKPEEHAINLIEGHGWNALLHVKTELDKPMIMKALAYDAPDGVSILDDDVASNIDVRDTLLALGFAIAQKEEFFIALLADKSQATEAVTDPDEKAAA